VGAHKEKEPELLALLFALASLAGLVSYFRRAGWSLRRVDRRGVYWCLLGMALGLLFAFKPAMPALISALAVGGLGAAFLYGIVADWQGWWTK
jgi:hypothetical protein